MVLQNKVYGFSYVNLSISHIVEASMSNEIERNSNEKPLSATKLIHQNIIVGVQNRIVAQL